MNAPRDFIREICDEKDIALEALSHGYVLRLSKGSVTRQIFGVYWDINSAAADRIACDKTACYTLLNASGIPAIAHELIFNPLRRAGYAGPSGAWAYALRLFEAYHEKVVVKPNQGTKGQDVYLCESIPELEAAAQAIFATQPDAAISPYHEITTEYRVFFVAGRCPYVYGKAKGESWQHNLSQGATAFELENRDLTQIKDLGTRAANCIGITFATVDIAELPSGKLAVMEINAGVQARQLLDQLPHLRPIIKDIYATAIDEMFT